VNVKGYPSLRQMSGVTVRNDKELTLLTPLLVTRTGE